MNKKTFGLALMVTGGAIAVAAIVNMNAAKIPTAITKHVPVFPTGKNAYNVGVGIALAGVGYWLKK